MEITELREATINKYRLERDVRDSKISLKELRNNCTMENRTDQDKLEGRGCFEYNFEVVHRVGYSFFEGQEELCPQCTEYISKRLEMVFAKNEIGKIKRQINAYARRELKSRESEK